MNRIDLISIARSTVLVVLCLWPAAARAQDPPPSPWTWSADANVFFGYNYQQRLFADFSTWESQNWIMASGERLLGQGRLMVHAMTSLEPFTIKSTGSPQLFQTGESYLFWNGVGYDRTPLVNSQHPHDLLMRLGATYRAVRPRVTYVVGADLVGSPTLGPTPFMHRESSRSNPQVPITHHFMDSTHSSAGVVRAGIEASGFTMEVSAFRGEEPDEHRKNLERPRLNSWAARLGWKRGPWAAQVSGGRLHEPEWFEPYDETRLTASIAFDGQVARRPLSATLGWGQNRHSVVLNPVHDGFLLEWDFRPIKSTSVYGRGEIAVKQLFGLGLHPRGFLHPHAYSHLDALTLGALHDVGAIRWSRFGVGADVTLYHMSPDMLPYFEGSHSYHVFLRWRPNVVAAHHVH